MEFLFQKDLRTFAAPFGMKGVALIFDVFLEITKNA